MHTGVLPNEAEWTSQTLLDTFLAGLLGLKIINGRGDLYDHKNLVYCKSKFKNSMDIITADGGFDFSNDYNNQEKNAFRLIFTQVAYAVTMQKHNGHFILKIFDMFENNTIELSQSSIEVKNGASLLKYLGIACCISKGFPIAK